jgi:two-component system, NtrC family, response regulator GlrR
VLCIAIVQSARSDTEVVVPLEHEVFRVRAAVLVVRDGPNSGQSMRVEVPSFVVGTGELADFRLTDPTVSREHLRLGLDGSGVRVRDSGSRNGTFIGGIRVRDVVLTASATLTLGATTLAVELDTNTTDVQVSASARFGDAIGVSPAMRHVFAVLESASRGEVTIVLEGESGVGKEILARAVHSSSPRAAGPFVALNCGAFAANLIESELFGHERGSFTGAHTSRRGLFEEASGGTLFLDEIGELPLDLQPKLLRVLEEREVRPLGSRLVKPVDVRIVAATNRHLADAVEAGAFRRDLFYRLAVVLVTIPPLRDRPEDIEPLARAFLHRRDPDATLSPELAAMLRSYAWPGNAREVRNVIERYAIFGESDHDTLFVPSRSSIPPPGDDLSHLPFHEARRIAMDRFERTYFPKVLERANGVVSKAAQLARVARPSFYRMLERVRPDRDSHA